MEPSPSYQRSWSEASQERRFTSSCKLVVHIAVSSICTTGSFGVHCLLLWRQQSGV